MASYTLQDFTNDASSPDLDATNLNEMDNAIKVGHDFADGASSTPEAGKAMVWPENASGTFAPTITFGGASTGITYSRNIGRWQREGNKVSISISFALTSKGSATGAFLLDGLPVACGANQEDRGAFYFLGSVSNAGYIAGLCTSFNSTQITLYTYNASGTETSLSSANFSDISAFRILGFYFV